MERYQTQKQFIRSVLMGILILFSVLACAKTLVVGMDIDESYSFAVAYRMVKGDLLLRDLWEPHQFSGIFLYPILALYTAITGGTTGIVIYTRVVGTLLHLLVGMALCRTFRSRLSAETLLLLFLIHVNYLPKWVQSPEFELLQYWFFLLEFVCLYRAYAGMGHRTALLLLAGLLLVCQILCYPSLILLYPVGCIGILLCNRGLRLVARLREVVFFTLGAAVPGGMLLLYILRYLTVSGLIRNLKRLNSDLSHAIPLSARLLQHLQSFLPILLLTGGVLALICLISRILWKRGVVRKYTDGIFCGICAVTALLSVVHFWGLVFLEVSQFFMLWRYFVILCMGFLLYGCCARQKEKKDSAGLIVVFALIPALISFFGVLLVTNMNVNISSAKLFAGVMGTCLLLGESAEGQRASSKALRSVYPVAMSLFLCSLLLCRLVFVRVTGCIRCTVAETTLQLQDGPAKGIWMLPQLATPMNEDYEVVTQLLGEDDVLLYIGCESLIYLWTDAAIAGASTQGTTVFNQLYIDYLNEHPDKAVTAVVVDKEMWVYPYYYNSEWNSILLDWIQVWFGYTQVVDTEYLTIYLKR